MSLMGTPVTGLLDSLLDVLLLVGLFLEACFDFTSRKSEGLGRLFGHNFPAIRGRGDTFGNPRVCFASAVVKLDLDVGGDRERFTRAIRTLPCRSATGSRRLDMGILLETAVLALHANLLFLARWCADVTEVSNVILRNA
jgi:hypothetical protein